MFLSDSFFFFKQKTAYEMRISDWSSDVCSSDLRPAAWPPASRTRPLGSLQSAGIRATRPLEAPGPWTYSRHGNEPSHKGLIRSGARLRGAWPDRKSVV